MPSNKADPPTRRTSLQVDTKAANLNAKAVGATTGLSSRGTINPSPAQDTHPYQRGSVIEVWHVTKSSSQTEDEDWWSEPDSSSEDDEVVTDEANKATEGGADATNSAAALSSSSSSSKRNRTIRLCDIVDRAQTTPGGPWRYYVHYRDFNRRMDEWITLDKIVSPPSVGNAKARALKKEEERKKKKSEQAAAAAAAERQEVASAPRSRRRASTATIEAADAARDPTAGGGGTGVLTTGAAPSSVAAAAASAAAAMGGSTPVAAGSTRRRRQSRRKTIDAFTDDDAASVMASNADETSNYNTSSVNALSEKSAGVAANGPTSKSIRVNKKEVLALPTDAVMMHTVGEHVVATLKAQELDEHEGLDEASLREHEMVTAVKNVRFLELGEFQMETWYFSPLPKELLGPEGFIDILYVCEFTFALFARKSELRRHQSRLPVQNRHPPGNEIYRKGNLSMFEVDGLIEKIYCQNLCFIAKLFLDHKTLYYDVDPFLFYVLCEVDNRGFHPVGYYSKEKYSDVGYNLACILTFPAHQRKGYGRFLIAFSYELTKKEEKVGSPEKPMSDLGQQAYKPYWTSTIIDFLLNQSTESHLSIMDISKKTSIMAEDIVFTLNQLGLLKIINGVYFVAAERNLLTGLAKKYPIKEPRVDPSKLHWTPFLTDVKRDKFSIHSKKPSVEIDDSRGSGGF